MKLKFQVKAIIDGDSLAAFQYREWADDWKTKMCATGIVVEDVTPEPDVLVSASERCSRCNQEGHEEKECEWPFPQGHANQVQRDTDWSRLNSLVVGAENEPLRPS